MIPQHYPVEAGKLYGVSPHRGVFESPRLVEIEFEQPGGTAQPTLPNCSRRLAFHVHPPMSLDEPEKNPLPACLNPANARCYLSEIIGVASTLLIQTAAKAEFLRLNSPGKGIQKDHGTLPGFECPN